MTSYLDILTKYGQQLSKEGDKFLESIGKFVSVRAVLVEVYRELVKKGQCIPIEKLTHDEKRELWQEAKRISSNQEKNYLIEVAKALHGLGSYLQLTEKIKDDTNNTNHISRG